MSEPQQMSKQKDYTDLGHYTTYANGHHPVFLDKTGQVEGHIYKFHTYSNKLTACALEDKVALEEIGVNVGRIFVTYENGRLWVGTGFIVSNQVVATARHVIKHFRGGSKLLTVHFSTRASALVSEFDPTSDDTFELTPLSHWASTVPAFNTKFYSMSGGFTDNVSDANTWKTSNDFAFLKFKSSSPENMNYILPKSAPENGKCCVIGYPESIEEDKFVHDYAEQEPSITRAIYEQVFEYTGGFERKILSVGNLHALGNGLRTHRCPTMRGTSGGLVTVLNSQRFFIGIHISGKLSMQNNFMVPVDHPEFALEYCKQVCMGDAKFVADNHAHLVQYLAPFKIQIHEHFPLFAQELFV